MVKRSGVFNWGGRVESSPAYWNGHVYVGCYDQKVYAFDTSGKLKWSFLTDQPIVGQSPVIDKGRLYINTEFNHETIYCLDALTGRLIWQKPGEFSSGSSLVVKNGVVYNSGTNLLALDAVTGQLRWSYWTLGGGTMPVVLNNKIYVEGKRGTLYVLNETTGALLWQKDALGDPEAINIGYGFLYALNTDPENAVVAIDTTNGARKWYTKSPEIGYNAPRSSPRPVVYDSTIYFSGLQGFYAYNAFTGVRKWRAGFEDIVGGGTVVNNITYCTVRGNWKGSVVALEPVKGYPIWWSEAHTDFNVSAPCVVTKSGKMHRYGEVFN